MEFKGKIYLAPMNGITNAEFRKNCILHGADVVETPLLSAKAIIANKIKVIEEIKSIANQRPCGVQIFFANCPQAVDACKQILKIFRPDYIDLNMGCPSPRVCREEAGCALMRNPNLIYRIVKNVVKEINVPIVVKIRSGWNKDKINAVAVAKLVQEAGASAIIIHPRTRDQAYDGKADWSVIAAVKKNVTIPVIGNGDIVTAKDAYLMKKATNCDSVMVGRGAIKNPNIFKEIKTAK